MTTDSKAAPSAPADVSATQAQERAERLLAALTEIQPTKTELHAAWSLYLYSLYRDDRSLAQVAAMSGYKSAAAVSLALQRGGIDYSETKYRNRKNNGNWFCGPMPGTIARVRRFVKLHNEGLSYRRIAKMEGTSQSTVGNLIARYGHRLDELDDSPSTAPEAAQETGADTTHETTTEQANTHTDQ